MPSSSWRTQGETGHGARWPPVPGPRMALCKWVVSSAIKRGHEEGTSILCFARSPPLMTRGCACWPAKHALGHGHRVLRPAAHGPGGPDVRVGG